MKRRINLLTAAFAVFGAAFLIFAAGAGAQSFRTGDNVTVPQGEKIDKTLFISGRNIDVNAEVNGDIFCAGQTITISGKVSGDVICAGQTVRVTGTVDGDVRLAGQTVSLGANVGGSASIGAQSFTFDSGGKVGRDLSVGSQDSSLAGQITRDAAIGSTTSTVSGIVGRNIKAGVTNMTLANGANVGGNIDYTSWNDLKRDSGAKVAGSIVRTDPPREEGGRGPVGALGFSLGFFIYALAAMLLVSMLLALIFPRFLQRLTDRAFPMPWKPLLFGLLAGIIFPMVFIVVLITVIGIPLAIILLLAWLLALALSGPVAAYYIGRLVLRDTRNALLYMLAGSVVLIVAYFVPIIGFLALLFAAWTGVGLLVLEIFDRTPRPVYEVAGVPANRRNDGSKPAKSEKPKAKK